jgi:hypothetical protein
VFQRLRSRYPRAYSAFGEERRREILLRYEHSYYIEEQKKSYPYNPEKDDYIEALKRLRKIMILFKLGYGSREMNILRVNSSRRYPDAWDAFERELEDM